MRVDRFVLIAWLGWLLVTHSLAQEPASVSTPPGREAKIGDLRPEVVVLPKSVPDPIEPFNRIVYSINNGIMTVLIKPTANLYRHIVIKPVRTGISHFGRNLSFPGRLLNNLLQGKWSGARDETTRFVCNTTVGLAGVWDVATRWKIPKSDADFGETFGQWGWKPCCFLMLPLFGPSNERDSLGLAMDTMAHPLVYFAPYQFDSVNPLTYIGPYTYFSYANTYNTLADSIDEYVRFSQAEMDPYSEIQYAWTFARENRVADFKVKGSQDTALLETLQSVFFTFKDPGFPDRGRTRSVLIPATGRKLPFTFWLQSSNAPVVYIVPGLGSHRLAQPSLALAELAYKNGFSAVCVSSTFNSEFMERASTAALPAYLPVDGHDMHVALTEMDRHLNAMYPNRLGRRGLLGYSMGGLHTLFIAATSPTNALPLLPFDRFVAVHTPVRLLHGVAKLDEFYQAPLGWPAAERIDNLENAFLKVAALSKGTLTPHTSLPFDAIESKFLIGLTFRLMLRDIIFSSQRRINQGVLKHTVNNLKRTAVYQEILENSYRDYFERFVIPYYATRGLTTGTAEALEQADDLRTYEAALRGNSDIRVIVNRNDFLLAAEDLAWLHTTFGPERLSVFEQGGHLGNLFSPAVQETILEALSGLKSAPP